MTPYNEIKNVHLEITTLCNAVCPLCPRNSYGYTENNGYPETNMTLDQAKKIFTTQFLKQLDTININGNYGDAVMNPETISIVEYFRNSNEKLNITLNTNGSARNSDWWTELAKLKVKINFAIDGLSDTHSIYRQNTRYDVILKNAKTFIDAGGIAMWKMIKFKHNEDQIEEAKKISKDMNFFMFSVVEEGRDNGPVFDNKGELVRIIGDYSGPTSLNELQKNYEYDTTDTTKITCYSVLAKSIYVAANGDVSPCCWTGFYPKTFRSYNNGLNAVNEQLSDMMYKYNALEHTLSDCVEWFNNFSNKWNNKKDRIKACDFFCGSK